MPDTPQARLAALGLTLPEPMQTANLPFELIRITGNHAYLAGHVPLAVDGSLAHPLGKVGADLTADGDQRFAQPVELLPRLALGGLDHQSPGHWPAHGRCVEAVVH